MDKLKIENLDLYYEKFHALKSINLSIPRNRIAAFIGPLRLRARARCSKPSTA